MNQHLIDLQRSPESEGVALADGRRQEAEAALEKSQDHLRLALEIARLGTFQIDTTTDSFLEISETLKRQLGFAPEDEITPDDVVQRRHPEDRDKVTAAFRLAQESHQDFHIEYRYLWPNGSIHWIASRGRPVYSETGEAIGLIGVTQDVTERKQAEKAQLRLVAIVNSSDDAIIGKTLEGIITSWNLGAEKVFGYSTAEAVGQSILMLFPPERLSEEGEFLARIGRGESVKHFDTVRVRRDGTRIQVSVTLSPIMDAEGKVIGISKIARDVTEHKQAERELQQSQERLLLALESGRLGTYHIDTTTSSYLEISETLKRQLGFAPEDEITQADVVQRRHPEDRDKVTGVIQAAQDSHRYLESESRYVWPDGSIHWIASNGRPVYSETGEAIGLIGITQDVTERKEAEAKIQELNQTLEQRVAERTAQLEAANRELEAFSYSVSHDLRAPLRSIDGFSQALLEDYTDRLDKTGQDFLKRVRAASQRMSVLIDDLLSLSRVTRSEMQRQQVNLSALASTLSEELGTAHPERSVKTSITPELWADADPQLLRIVIGNLLENAWKYTAKCPAARIEIGQTEYADKLCFFVRDNGAGFDMDAAAKLFTPFQRMHTQQEFEGTGIGLATVQRILHRHGGRIWAEAAVDQGATFYFTV
jgi:PAS domain S-box-containing protein